MKIELNRKELEEAIIGYINKRGTIVNPDKLSFVMSGQKAVVDIDYDSSAEVENAKEMVEANNELEPASMYVDEAEGTDCGLVDDLDLETKITSEEVSTGFSAPVGFGA